MINGVKEGATGSFQATPIPLDAVVPAGIVPVWTSSDPSTATVADPNPDATGLSTVLTGIKTGTISLSVSATLADGTVVSGSVAVPIEAGQIIGFTINQTA